MRKRCRNRNHPDYKHYGGRGIKVCDEWGDFAAFVRDMGERPSPEHSIDRIDPNGDYTPANCRWATITDQIRNRRNTTWLTLNGRRQALTAWAEELGVGAGMLRARKAIGWSDEKILTTPKQTPEQIAAKRRLGMAARKLDHRDKGNVRDRALGDRHFADAPEPPGH